MKKASRVGSIVVGVDFSKEAKASLAQGRALAKKWNVPLMLVHGFEDPVVSEVRFNEIIKSVTQYYEKRIAKAYHVQRNEKVQVRCGRPYEEIIKAAKSFPNPLIIVGNQGAGSRFKKLFLGSTAERVAQRSPFPVFIHRGKLNVGLKKALLPCDLTDRTAHALNFLKKNSLGSQKSELYHVIPYPIPVLDLDSWREQNIQIQRNNSMQLAKFRKSYPRLKVGEFQGDTFYSIESHAKKFDFIALTPRKDKGFFAGFGSVTSKIVRASKKSVLIIP